MVAKAAKWVGPPEASPVRRAHLLAPADWIVCARSGARDLSPPYAIFFNGNSVQHFRLAVEMDDCLREPYALVVITGASIAVVAPPPQPEPKVVPNPSPCFGLARSLPRYSGHACRHSDYLLERPATFRRAVGSGRSASPVTGTGSRVDKPPDRLLLFRHRLPRRARRKVRCRYGAKIVDRLSRIAKQMKWLLDIINRLLRYEAAGPQSARRARSRSASSPRAA